MTTNQISVDKIREIGDGLPHGSQKKISAKLGISETTVNKTLKARGKYLNPDVIREACRIYKAQQRKAARLNSTVESLTSK